MKKYFLFISVLVIFLLCSCADVDYFEETDLGENCIVIPFNNRSCEGKDYLEVTKMFEDVGLTNIKYKIIYDLIFGWLTKDGEVEKVHVNDTTTFEKNTPVDINSEIVIEYHTFSDNAYDVEMPYSKSTYESGLFNTNELVAHFKELGFYNVFTHKENPEAFQMDEIYQIKIDYKSSDFNKGDKFKVNVSIDIYYCEVDIPITVESNKDLKDLVEGNYNHNKFLEKYLDQVIQFEATIGYSYYVESSRTERAHYWLRVYTGNSMEDENGFIFDVIAYNQHKYGYYVGKKVIVTGKVVEPKNDNFKYIVIEWINVYVI